MLKCPPHELARLISVMELVSYEQGHTIFKEGDDAVFAYYVISGRVAIINGKKQKRVVEQGRYFGQEGGFWAPHYLDDAVTEAKVFLIRMPAQELARVLNRNEHMRSEIIFSLLRDFRRMVPYIMGVSRNDPAEKLSLLSSMRLLFGWGATLVAPLLTYFLLAQNVISASARIYVSLLVAGVLMWIFELVDSYIVGIFLVVTALVLRLAPAEVILSGFSSATFFMALGILSLGSILVNSGILYRLLLHVLKRIPDTQIWSNVSIFILGIAMTMAIPVAANRVEVVTPFLNEFTTQTRVKSMSNSATKLAMSAFFSVSLFSPIFLSGSLHNFMLLGLLWAQDQERFQWIGWLQASFVTGLIILVGYAIPFIFLLKTDDNLHIDRNKINDQLKALGPITRKEKFALICFLLFSIGMMTQSLHRLPPQLIGLFILFALLVLEILTRDNFQNLINWPALFLLGCLIGLINFFNHAHLNLLIVEHLGWLGAYIKTNFYLFIILMVVVINVVRLCIPYGPAVVLLGTVFVSLAQQYEVNPWTIGFLVLLIGKMWFYPAQYPPFQDFQRLSSKVCFFSKKTIIIYNVYMDVVKIAAIYLSIPYWRTLGVL